MDRFVVISGCSGGGKSTLIAELGEQGYSIVEEPGRRIVKAEMASGSSALPWVDPIGFAERAVELALADRASAMAAQSWVFFDRGLIDAASFLQHLTNEPTLAALGHKHRYHRRVFMVPPWRELFVPDSERRHGFEEAMEEYVRLLRDYRYLDYEIVELERTSVAKRIEIILQSLVF